MEQSYNGLTPDSAERGEPGLADELEDSELAAAAGELTETEAELEERREEYERAREKMTSRIRELRSSLKIRLAELKDETARQALIAQEAAGLAATFKESEQLAILRKLMPNRFDAVTAREKFTVAIELGLDLSYWDRQNFVYAYNQKFGRGAESKLDDEADALREAFLREFPELEDLDEAA